MNATIFSRLPRRLILRSGLSPGDIVTLTAAVRDLHRAYPAQFLTDVRTSCPALWEHNPYITPLDESDPGVEVVDCHYPLIAQCNRNPLHFLHGYTAFLGQRLGLRFSPTACHGAIYLSAAEQARPSKVADLLGQDVPFWIVAAGGKHDYTIKWWDPARYQKVMDAFRGRVLFVQVGERGHHHPPLRGVLDWRGRTSLRELILLMYHAHGVLCPVTSLMHLAAAVPTRPGRAESRACVVIAGGREPPHWEAYPGHQFIHTVGTLACCAKGGCWRARTLPLGDDDEKDESHNLCLDVVNELPRCMDLISAADVVRRIETYFDGGQMRYLTREEAAGTLRFLSHVPCGSPRPSTNRGAPSIGQSGSSKTRAVTICALTYGDNPRLIRRCLESIRQFCQRSAFRLVVGANAPSPRSLRYLLNLRREGFIDRLHLSPVNLNKCPMMRRMFQGGIETEFVWWFDDDSHVLRRTALPRRLTLARQSPPEIVAWGHRYFMSHEDQFDCGCDLRTWIRAASWYRSRPLPSWDMEPTDAAAGNPPPAPDGRWFFLTGGNWFARTEALQAMDWPDRRLILQAEDILLGEAIRQQGWGFMDIGSLGVAIEAVRSRCGDKAETMRRQMEQTAA